MDTNKMELSMEQKEQVTGGENIIDPGYSYGCPHSNRVKTSWLVEEDFFYFWTKLKRAYVCPDCQEIIWYTEDIT